MNRENIEDLYRLTPIQQGILVHALEVADSRVYTEQFASLKAHYSAENLGYWAAAWEQLIARHAVLRTSVLWEDLDEPIQVVHKRVPFDYRFEDLSARSPAEQDARLAEVQAEERRRGFDLTQPPLFRFVVLRRGPEVVHLVWTYHHLILDGWSVNSLLQDVAATGRAIATGSPLRLPERRPFKDYVTFLRKQVFEDAEGYWRRRFADVSAATPLPCDRPAGGAEAGYDFRLRQLTVEASAALQQFARGRRITLNTAVVAAYAALLGGLSGQDEVVFGQTLSGRPLALRGAEAMLGCFINTLPVRVSVAPRLAVGDLLDRVQTDQLELRRYEGSSLVEVLRASGVGRQQPLFESILVFENVGQGAAQVREEASFQRTNYALTLVAVPGERVGFRAGFERSRFDEATIERLLEHLETLLVGLPALVAAGGVVGDWRLLTAEQERALVSLGDGGATFPSADTLAGRFARQVAARPEAPALTCEGRTLSYRELDAQANRLARRLVAWGVQPETRVGLVAERSLELVVAILAIVKASGAYVPFDPAVPPERLAFLVEDSGAPLILVADGLEDRLVDLPTSVRVENLGAALAGEDDPGAPAPALDADHLAYVIYTSGSTGKPKGSLLSHRNVVRLLDATDEWFHFGPDDVWTLFHSYAFDFSVWEVWGALLSGGRLVVVPYWVSRSPEAFRDLLASAGVTVLNQTPSAWKQLVAADAAGPVEALGKLRAVIFGGEALEPSSLAPWYRRHGDSATLINMYGITETTVHVTYRALTETDAQAAGASPIGVPIPDLQLYLLDGLGRPVPLGVAGEIHVGGPGLARGYLGRPGLTAERFVPHPFGPAGARLYRSGDLARRRSPEVGGELEFLGRIDQQVKIRGFRIELGEIESTLLAHPGVREVAVVAREDRPGDLRLVAYVVGGGVTGVAGAELKAHAGRHLPDYMVPAVIVELAALPLTVNGKLDRRALPVPEGAADATAQYEAPRGPIEESVAAVWSEVLGAERVGRHDDFFELGGHSLLATKVISRLKQRLGVTLALRTLFEASTVVATARALAELTGAAAGAPAGSAGSLEGAEIPRAERPVSGEMPLGFGQERLWFLDRLEPGSATYNVPFALRLRGELDVAALARALGEIFRRHESLRTVFVEGADGPVQRIEPWQPPPLALVDLSALPPALRELTAARLAAREAAAPFDLAAGPPARFRLVRLGASEHAALWTAHHIVSDGVSTGIFLAELAALYRSEVTGVPSPLAELPVQVADVAAWQRRTLAGAELERQLAFWREGLAGLPERLDLPSDRPRPAQMTYRGAAAPFHLPAELGERLRALAKKAGATPFMVFLAAYGALLSRLAGADDLAVGAPAAGRRRIETEGLIGFFVNTLVLRLDTGAEPSFTELVTRAKAVTLGAYAHEDVPFEKVVEELAPARSLAHAPLFQVMLSFEAARGERIELGELTLAPQRQEIRVSKFDLTLAVSDSGAAFGGHWAFSTDLFDPTTVQRFGARLVALLTAALAAPETRLAALPVLTAAERQATLVEWNDPRVEYGDSGALLPALFRARVAAGPERIALVTEAGQVTYGELAAHASAVARRLRARGVGPESIVGICAERSVKLVAGLLGILEAGAAYLPIDPELPEERRRFLIADSGAALVLGAEDLGAEGPATDAPPPVLHADHAAYVIYTSGSTGVPKGVVVSHGALINRLHFALANDVGPESVFLHKTTISFDVSILEIFAPLLAGGRTVLAKPGGAADPEYLLARMVATGVTHTSFPPTLLSALLDAGRLAELPSLESVVTGGEVVPPDLAERFYGGVGRKDKDCKDCKDCKEEEDGASEVLAVPAVLAVPSPLLFNRYGPTETTISVTSWTCRPGRPPERVLPIGRPTAKAEIHLLDRAGRPVAVGVPGELHVGGPVLARGYLNRPAKTAESFVPDPFSGRPGTRLYRTGDLARWRTDGALEFAGRIDTQVKIRGFRVELGEIEAALAQHEDVREVAVVDWGEGNAKTLAAYLVPRNGRRPTNGDLRARLDAALPPYMVPSTYQWLERLPLNPSGKIDRKALPAPNEGDAGALDEPPLGATEQTLAAIWREVLARDSVGRHAGFFELGGHSLLATQVISRARAAFQVDLPLRTLFEQPTVAGLARQIEREIERRIPSADVARPDRPALVALPRVEGEELPLSFAQERLWFLERLDAGRGTYNIAVALGLRGPLEVGRLSRALAALVARHEALRTTFGTGSAGTPIQRIADRVEVPLPVADLVPADSESVEEAIDRHAAAEADEPFDLAVGPLLRARLLRLAADDHVFLLTVHHLVSDGWSAQVMLREIRRLYGADSRGDGLPPLAIQYADFARWQRLWLTGPELDRQLDYWRAALAGAPELVELPADRPRPAVAGAQGRRLPVQLAGAFSVLAEATGTTPFMLLLAAWGAFLGRLAGVDDVVVGAPVANRHHPEIEGLVGFFVNTLALRVETGGDPSFRTLLGRVRATTLAAYDHQDLPFEKLVAELAPTRSRSHSPLFQVMLVLQNAAPAEASPVNAGDLAMRTLLPAGTTTKFDLTLSLSEVRDGHSTGFRGFLGSKSELFDATTVMRWRASFERFLAAAVALPERPLSALPWLGRSEEHQLRHEWNDTARAYPLLAVTERIAGWAGATPDALALIDAHGRGHSYRQLLERADRLAARLRAAGAGPERVVAVCCERGAERIVAILGALRSGAAYLPLEPAHPDERLAELLAGADPVAIVADGSQRQRWPSAIPVDDAAAGEVALPDDLDLDTLAYLIFTSGSTGRPKPVGISHRALAERLEMMAERFELGPGDRQLQFVSVAFDMAVEEIFATLASGATLVLAPAAAVQKPSELLAWAAEHAVTKINLPASLWHQIADDVAAGTVALPQSLRILVTGAEPPSPEKFATLLAALPPGATAFNLYGPTETTIIAAGTRLDARTVSQGAVPLGRPLPGARLQVVDRSGRTVPIGVAGELWIAGDGLARGYLGRPGATAERFVPDAGSPLPGARAYRTGDRVRVGADGTLEFLGRLDQQVKVRGFRIELGEIEEHLRRHPAVADAAVVARPDGAGSLRLVAYLVTGDTPPNVTALRSFLAESLPDALIPAVFVPLAELPRNSSGKVDRRALPAPELDRPTLGSAYQAPRTELERYLAALVEEVLGVRQAGVLDNFFDLGGDSLKGAVLINRLEQTLGEYVYVTALFDTANLAELADYLTTHYPRAVAARFGAPSATAAEPAAPVARVTPARALELRAVITPLAPFVAPAGLVRNPSAVFLLSPPRSGSTLLRVLLAGHPSIFAPPEIDLLSFDTLADRRQAFSGRYAFWLEGLVRAVMAIDGGDAAHAEGLLGEVEAQNASVAEAYGWLQARLGGRLLVDKTPSYALDAQVLARAEALFEGPRYVHLLRHPYGMIRSFEEARLDQTFFRHDHPFSRRELAELVWLVSQENILAHLSTIEPERHTVVRFEELVADPRPVLERLSAFLGLEFDPEMLEPYKERERRMTDGVHPLAKMLGDVKFHQHQGIDSNVAERWREAYPEEFLGDVTWEMAARLGYPAAAPAAAARTALVVGGWQAEESLPLSFGQERLWFLERLGAGGTAYHLPTALALAGPLDTAVLTRALSALVARHASLRTRFVEEAEGPVQQVAAPSVFELEILAADGATKVEIEAEAEVESLALAVARRPFDLAAGPPFRAALIRRGAEDHLLVLVMHHLVSDGWSLGLAVRELAAFYGAFAGGRPDPLPPLALQYPDFARWQRRHLAGGELERQASYWLAELADVPPLELPTDRPRPVRQRFRGAGLAGALPTATGEALLALGRAERASAFMVLSTLFAALLARFSGQDDFALGTPVAGRNRRELEGLVGFFVNTLALRQRYRPEESFRSALARARGAVSAALAHQEVPFEHLVEGLQPERHLSRSPLFQVMFSLQDLPAGPVEATGVAFRPVELEVSTAKFDLNLAALTTGGRVTLRWVYDTDLFDAATVERLAKALERLAADVAADPDQPLGRIELLSAAERAELMCAGVQRSAPGTTLERLVEDQVDRTPAAVALVVGESRLTYAELDARANQLAHRLAALGCGAEDRVGVVLERGAELVVALLATLKAGAAYVPVDPAFPAERMAYLLADAGVRVVVTEEGLVPLLAGVAPAGSPLLVVAPGAFDDEPHWRLELPAEAESAAYVLYTSGSTGRPKGVVVPQRALVNFLSAMAERPGFGAGDTMLAVTTVSFDIAALEIWLPLATGGRVVMATRDEAADGAALLGLLALSAATHLQATPATWRLLLEAGWRPTPGFTALCGGEALPRELARELAGPASAAWNLYGPTETTVWSAACPVGDEEGPVPFGEPIAETALWVVDRPGLLVPTGVAGELLIGGDGVARGYLGRPGLTAECFVPDPFSGRPGARVYRTGDRVRRRPDGLFDFLGRLDFQVKLRGFRIELGEIEAVLGSHPDVAEVAVALDSPPGVEPRLVAWWVATERVPAPEELRRFVLERLPAYMVPALFVAVAELPRTANRKLDRRRLHVPAAPARVAAPRTAPRNDTERLVAALFGELLRLDEVGLEDGFFARGGHSLLAARLVARVRRDLGIELALRQVFETPTLAELARAIDGASATATRPPRRRTGPRPDRLPLSFAQERLWFLDRLEPGSALYHLPLVVRRRGDFNVAAFAASLTTTVARHESLRTRFPATGGVPTQVVEPPSGVPPSGVSVTLVDLSALPAARRDAVAARVVRLETLRPFDLARGPLLRAAVVRGDATDHRLVLTVHHLVADGASIEILARELADPRPRPPLALQYPDYALEQRAEENAERFAELLERGCRRLADAPRTIALPLDRPRTARPSASGGRVEVPFSPAQRRGVDELARGLGATRFMVLLAALGAVLERFGAGSDVVLGTPVSGRDREELQEVVGLFINTLALRLAWAPDASFADRVVAAREVTLDGYADQALPFEQLVQAVAPERDLGSTPIFQVLLNWQEGMASLETERAFAGLVAFDLTLSARPTADGVAAALEYRRDLFDDTTVRRLAGALATLVGAAALRPEQPLGDLAVIALAERRQLLLEWAEPQPARVDLPATLHGLVAAQAARTPEAPAVVGRGLDGQAGEITYRELQAAAGVWAGELARRGVGPEVPVAVLLERRRELIVAILAVLAAGGTWVPIDPAMPDERIAFLLADSGARQVLTQASLVARLPADLHEAALVLDGATLPSPEVPTPAVDGCNAAYVVYTSGSTGRPKGVVVEHRAVVHYVAHEVATYGLGPGARSLQLSSIGFDAAIDEIFDALGSGATLVLADPDLLASAERFFGTLEHQGITTLGLPTALWRELGAALPEAPPPPALRVLSFGGERADAESFARWRRWLGPGVALINAYGPTEATIAATRWRAPARGEVAEIPIGRPVTAARAVVLDARGRLLARGAVGALALGGPALARGYRGAPAATAERFRPDPFAAEPGARLYHTGDLARWSAGGELYYVGRIDEQVKVRGFRVELGEIEARLAALPGVREALVLVREERAGEPRLLAWVVAETGLDTAPAALARALGCALPGYMVPDTIVVLAALPRTAHGKVDRAALPTPPRSAARTPGTAPRTALEAAVCAVFAEVLGLAECGVDDDFFAAGGHSLLALRLHARLEARLGRRVAVADLFRAPTPAALAGLLEISTVEAVLPAPLVELRRGAEGPALVLVHPVAGDLQLYRELVEKLPADQPVFGFESPTLRDPAAPLSASLEALAATYLAALTTFQPAGPYQLAGSSLGGAVAYEMARQATAAGHEVAFLGLIDTPQAGIEEPVPFDPTALRRAALRLLTGTAAGAVPTGLTGAEVESLLALIDHHARILDAYRPAPYPGRLTFFQAADSAAHRPDGRVPWSDLAHGGVERIEIPGGHVTMHRPPNVVALAEALVLAMGVGGGVGAGAGDGAGAGVAAGDAGVGAGDAGVGAGDAGVGAGAGARNPGALPQAGMGRAFSAKD